MFLTLRVQREHVLLDSVHDSVKQSGMQLFYFLTVAHISVNHVVLDGV